MQMTYREIGEFVGRPKTTVIRESKRLGNVDKYDAEKAQNDFELKQKNCGYKKK
jgi:IS30 family transposase